MGFRFDRVTGVGIEGLLALSNWLERAGQPIGIRPSTFSQWLPGQRANEYFIATACLHHRNQICEIAASTVKVRSVLPFKLASEEWPVLTQGPTPMLSTESIDPKQHLLDVGRKWVLAVINQIGQWVVSVLSVHEANALTIVSSTSTPRPGPVGMLKTPSLIRIGDSVTSAALLWLPVLHPNRRSLIPAAQ